MTFDDKSVRDWYEVDQALDKYNWKATFFVSQFHSLDIQEKQKLYELQHKGHEIASHSKNHLDATKYISTHSIDEYISAEVLPSIIQMKNEGFIVTSFAYPYGARETPVTLQSKIAGKIKKVLFGGATNALDSMLLEKFEIIRGIANGTKNPATLNSYSSGSRLVFGLGIDESVGNDIEYLYEILQYAKENNKIAIFYSHHVTEDSNPPEYTSTYKTLEKISRFVVNNNMHFLTMKDLLN